MSEGRVNPMFPTKLMLSPFVFILMIEIGSSPARIIKMMQSQVQTGKGGEQLNWCITDYSTTGRCPYMNTYIPVNEQNERSNLSMLLNSSMSEGRVNPMFLAKLMITPFAFILMIEIGNSPKRIKDDTKSIQSTKTGALKNWFTMVLFVVEVRLQDHKVKV
jgi:hypothetical protein